MTTIHKTIVVGMNVLYRYAYDKPMIIQKLLGNFWIVYIGSGYTKLYALLKLRRNLHFSLK